MYNELKMKVAAKASKPPTETRGPGFFAQVAIGLTAIGNEIYKNSYIFTNIIMMVSLGLLMETIFKMFLFFLFIRHGA